MHKQHQKRTYHGGVPDEGAAGHRLPPALAPEHPAAVAEVSPGKRPEAHVPQPARDETGPGRVPRDAQRLAAASLSRRLYILYIH